MPVGWPGINLKDTELLLDQKIFHITFWAWALSINSIPVWTDDLFKYAYRMSLTNTKRSNLISVGICCGVCNMHVNRIETNSGWDPVLALPNSEIKRSWYRWISTLRIGYYLQSKSFKTLIYTY